MTHPQIALWASAAQAFDQRYQLVGPDHQDLPTQMLAVAGRNSA